MYHMELDDNKLDGDIVTLKSVTETQMIPTILQLSESVVVNDSNFVNESVDEVRHKIIDRLVAFYMI